MKNIPLFPLNIVALPKEKIPLHIFEPRYKRMIKSSIKSGEPFGIVFEDQDGFKRIGCSVKIINVIKEYPSGEFDIVVEGQHCFQIQNKVQENDLEFAQKLYDRLLPLMQVNFLESNPVPVKAAMAAMGLMNEVYRLPMTSPQTKTRDSIIRILRDLKLNTETANT